MPTAQIAEEGRGAQAGAPRHEQLRAYRTPTEAPLPALPARDTPHGAVPARVGAGTAKCRVGHAAPPAGLPAPRSVSTPPAVAATRVATPPAQVSRPPAASINAAVEPVPPRFSSAGAIVADLRQQSSAEPDKPRGTLRDAVASDSMAVAFPATLRFSLADAVRSDIRQGGAYCRAAGVWKQTASRCQVTGFHRCSAYLRASRFHESLMGQAAVQHHSLDGSLTVRAVSSHAACS